MISFHKRINIKVCRSFCVSFVKSIFVCETFSISFFFSYFWSCFFSALMLCKPGFYFFIRKNVSFKTVSRKNKAVTPEMVAGWNETTLPTLLSNYGLENIYNDKLGWFYQCLPEKSYQLKTEQCSGGKHSKIRITGLAAANAVSSKLPMFVIGKAKNPRCFKNIKKLPCRYWSQRKSWMDSVLFEEWVRDINKKSQAEGRKVALIIDNCLAHPIIENLSHAKLVFFTTKYYIRESADGSRHNKMSQGPLQEKISKVDTSQSRF